LSPEHAWALETPTKSRLTIQVRLLRQPVLDLNTDPAKVGVHVIRSERRLRHNLPTTQDVSDDALIAKVVRKNKYLWNG